MTESNWQEIAYTLFEESGDALFLFDPESEQVSDVNPMAQRLSGYSRRELLAMKITYLFRAEVQGGLQRLRQAFRRTGLFHSQEGFWLRRRDEGAWLPVNLTITRLHTEPQTLGLITARDVSERRQAHAQLQKVEGELRRVLASIADCLWSAEVAEGRWTYQYFSPVVEKLTGRPAAAFLAGPEKWLAIVDAEDRPAVEKAYARFRHGQAGVAEYRLRLPDGATRWVRDNVRATPRPGGGLFLDGVLSDVTERKRVTEALRASESRQRILLEQLPAIVWTTDRDLRTTSSLGAGLAALGVQPNETVGRTLQEQLGVNDASFLPIAAHFRALRGESVSYEMVWKGRDFQTTVEPLRDAAGEIVGTIGISLDCTDRKRAEESLRASENKYRTLVDNLTQAIFLKDAEFRFAAVNPSMCRMLGLSESEILGKTDFDLYPVHLAERYRADDTRILREGVRLEQEEQTLIQGKQRTVQVVKSPVRNADGRVVGVLGIFWDVTDQRLLEAQLRQASKMDAIGKLAGGIAHDFNNLLTAALGNLELLQAELPKEHSGQELLTSALEAGFRAAELTRQLLSFARQAPLRPSAVHLDQCVEENVRLLKRTLDPRIVVQAAPTPGLWLVKADAAQISQVLMNLSLNARDAMPEGGTLKFETANVFLDSGLAAAHPKGRPGEFVRLSVCDSGHGMTGEVRERIFEPFFTTKGPSQGTGLGLAMVFGIISQHDGWIECHSEVGHGTCFDIYLPRLVGPVPQGDAPPPLRPRGGHETILLADDHELVRQLGREVLERMGYHVVTACDGIELLETFGRDPRSFDLVILDLSMPRLSGAETLRRLLAIDPDIPTLVSSGYHVDQAVHAVQAEGASAYLVKPYRPVELAVQVRDVLDRRSRRRSNPPPAR